MAVLVSSSCSPSETEHLRARTEAIIGGRPTGTADSQVFALLSPFPFCSSTLIHPRVLLTAAHCVENSFSVVTKDPLGYPDNSPRVAVTWAHPAYASTGTGEYDVALVLLQAPVTGVSPKAVQRTALPGLASGRAVGFGQRSVGANPPSGERYTIDLPITAVTSGQVRYGSPGAAICFGDSGGPFFATINGVETLIAVHSYTNDPTCSGGAGARVDAQLPVIATWFAANVCPRDGTCDPNCLAVDFDCTCRADGQCTAACTRPEFDPDCPAYCGSDGICAALSCPIPDLDCRSSGALCERDNQCVGQRCTTDPQHLDAYCSRPCSTATDCAELDPAAECDQGTCRFRQVPAIPEGGACQPGDRCADGTRCHLQSIGAVCARPCTSQSDCPAMAQCRSGLSTWKACVPAPVTLQSTVELPAASGCSSAGSGSVFLLALATLVWRRPTGRRPTGPGR